ncbi:platelet endothelial aggregation receptor 1-like [Trichoplusia ni]|uniref:Platelet endothelial aggregation receptor 1-like n=1 Tax=Trichoplusia ni TaxID=7111 RepID=A0A7E5X1W6_TRINI|nr:platelet endothelial aggregation receptor 1-like [Trichoplusia ni]
MCLKTLVFCSLVLLLVELASVDSLSEDGEGVCVVRLSSRLRRKKPYNVAINKWCGRKKCVVKKYKFETYLTWTNHTVCCHGWQHNSELDSCSPTCSTGCLSGRCVAPDRCQCDPPLRLDPDRPNTCVAPTCEPSCHNATCHANNTCVCNQNLTAYNSTHCYHCEPGYTADENLNCVPVCDKPCFNSTCSAPNTCSCKDGYKHKNSSVCEPICNCVNSICVAPNTCTCLDGYERVNKTACAPKCSACVQGVCVSPENCLCHSGYDKVKGECKPKCAQPCENGFCSAPNVCSCDEGYLMTSDNYCMKPCDPNCKDIDCARKSCNTARASGNDNQVDDLICDRNYEFDFGSDSCVPFDDPEVPKCSSCRNGQCVGPENCQCFEGYNMTNEGCSPICSEPCTHGYCSAPNNCSCDPGYQKTTEGCKPVCSSPCMNGYCSAPNNCSCNPGYHKTKEGCKPVCSSACLNGYCSSPNNCSCNKGYRKVGDVCRPVCSAACLNGYCSSPDSCTCNEGYHKEGDVCKPVCSKSCTNGHCTAPEYCTCEEGYKTNQTDYSLCFKPCLTACANGSCDLDGICVCFSDFEYDNDTQTCVPMKPISCFECSGTCSADGDCQCADSRPCYMESAPAERVSMAGLDLTLISIGGACLFLFILIVVVMQRIYHKRHKYESKPTTDKPVFGSVVYTVPNTLIQPRVNEEDNEGSCDEDTNDTLLRNEAEIP